MHYQHLQALEQLDSKFELVGRDGDPEAKKEFVKEIFYDMKALVETPRIGMSVLSVLFECALVYTYTYTYICAA